VWIYGATELIIWNGGSSAIALGHLIRFLNSNCSIQPTLSDVLEYFSLGLNYRV